jgi:UTP-glucose-1-phosphate uridylyltransferase
MCDVVTAVQPTVEQLLHLFGVIRDADRREQGSQAELIIEKPKVDVANVVTPVTGGNYLKSTSACVFAADLRHGIPD